MKQCETITVDYNTFIQRQYLTNQEMRLHNEKLLGKSEY